MAQGFLAEAQCRLFERLRPRRATGRCGQRLTQIRHSSFFGGKAPAQVRQQSIVLLPSRHRQNRAFVAAQQDKAPQICCTQEPARGSTRLVSNDGGAHHTAPSWIVVLDSIMLRRPVIPEGDGVRSPAQPHLIFRDGCLLQQIVHQYIRLDGEVAADTESGVADVVAKMCGEGLIHVK